MSVGWNCCVVAPDGDVWLEQLSSDGAEWSGEGPRGPATGSVAEVVGGCAANGVDPVWVEAVAAAIGRELRVGERRHALLVKRGSGWMFHASRSVNRASIARHGLDWRRMTGPGIAGSDVPKWPGVYLCSDRPGARWFAGMHGPGPADIWRVRVNGLWLEGDPLASGGGDDAWMISPEPIPADRVTLCERDVEPGWPELGALG